jgi:hypothetical protein
LALCAVQSAADSADIEPSNPSAETVSFAEVQLFIPGFCDTLYAN